MITDAIIEFFLSPLNYLLDNLDLPKVPYLAIPDSAFNTILEIIRPLGYFLPIQLIVNFLILSFALDHFHIVWSLFLRIKSFMSVHIFL